MNLTNRRNFIKAGTALAISGMVPLSALAVPERKIVSLDTGAQWAKPIPSMGHAVGISCLFPFYTVRELFEGGKTIKGPLCIAADHGHVFLSDGKELLKSDYPLLWKRLSEIKYSLQNGQMRYHYETDTLTFRLPRMQTPWESNTNAHLVR